MKSMNIVELGRLTKEELQIKKQEFIIEKMKLDKFFSDFLNDNILDHDHPDTPEWKEYKSKLQEYKLVNENIRWSNFYLCR